MCVLCVPAYALVVYECMDVVMYSNIPVCVRFCELTSFKCFCACGNSLVEKLKMVSEQPVH